MKRLAIIVVTITLAATSVLLFQLGTEPKDIDVSNCQTSWKDGHITSVICLGERAG